MYLTISMFRDIRFFSRSSRCIDKHVDRGGMINMGSRADNN